MAPFYGNLLVRVNAGFLMMASAGGLFTDIAGSFFGRGPEAILLGDTPGTGIGFIEAHRLALIIGVTLWRIAYSRNWHAVLAAVHMLLGTAVFRRRRRARRRLRHNRGALSVRGCSPGGTGGFGPACQSSH
jgi:hypothetical protein